MKWTILLLFLLSEKVIVHADHWHYPTAAPNGVILGQENWGGDCDVGRRQSPVDLPIAASVRGSFPRFLFADYDEPIRGSLIANTGHSIQINAPEGKRMMISGGGLPGVYHFIQMHFHWGSEHTINGHRYGLELHIVHKDTRHPSVADAAGQRAGLAVIGILFMVSDEPNPILDLVLDSAEQVMDEVDKATVLKHPFALEDLLPKNTSSYFRYEGSLTTPGCGEAVVWTVFTHTLPISMAQIEKFKSIKTNAGAVLTHNFRSLQPLNARPLVYVSGHVDHHHHHAVSTDNAAATTTVATSWLIVQAAIALALSRGF